MSPKLKKKLFNDCIHYLAMGLILYVGYHYMASQRRLLRDTYPECMETMQNIHPGYSMDNYHTACERNVLRRRIR